MRSRGTASAFSSTRQAPRGPEDPEIRRDVLGRRPRVARPWSRFQRPEQGVRGLQLLPGGFEPARQSRVIVPGERLEMVPGDAHGEVPVRRVGGGLLKLAEQALRERARGDAGRIEPLHAFQDRVDLLGFGAKTQVLERGEQLVHRALEVSALVDRVDDDGPDEVVLVGEARGIELPVEPVTQRFLGLGERFGVPCLVPPDDLSLPLRAGGLIVRLEHVVRLLDLLQLAPEARGSRAAAAVSPDASGASSRAAVRAGTPGSASLRSSPADADGALHSQRTKSRPR